MSYRVKVWPVHRGTFGETRDSIEVRGRTLADVVEGIRYRLTLDRRTWRGRDLWVQRTLRGVPGSDVWTFRPAEKGNNARPDRLHREPFL